MCGITGVLSKKNTSNPIEIIKKMTSVITHRGPNAEGFFVDNQIAFGHRRLSIIDLSDIANQPMSDYSERFTIVFNGEIYNFQEIKQQLDYPFITNGDTEVILAAYKKWGKDCLSYFNGMFAFAIWDKEEQSLFLARDRMAVKPLYFYQDNDTFLFASELRSILASGLVPKEINSKGIVDYLSYQSVHAPNTIIKNIFQLKGGQYAIFQNDVLSISTYWSLLNPTTHYSISTYEQAKTQVKQKLSKSIDLRMISDVPLGVFLSGGIDSGIITGIMSEKSSQPINTITVGFNEKEFDESEHALIVAEKFKTAHKSIILKPSDYLDKLPQILDSFDTPSSDGTNTYIVSMIAQQLGITVVQSGLGGDELFAGYPLFKQITLLKNKSWIWKIPAILRNSILGFRQSTRIRNKIKVLFETDNSLSNIYSNMRRVMSQETLGYLLAEEQQRTIGYNWVKEEIEQSADKLKRMSLLSQISYCEMVSYTQSVLLKDSDQMSMANSIELREPFFDYELVELALQIPDKFKVANLPKQLLIDSLEGILPKEIIEKKKQTFTFPFEVWLKNELKQLCEQNLKTLANYPTVFKIDAVMDYWQRFLNDDQSILWSEIWSLMILGHWLKQNEIKC
jgi:asparagine synthase (glutamine-hydrolysing)